MGLYYTSLTGLSGSLKELDHVIHVGEHLTQSGSSVNVSYYYSIEKICFLVMSSIRQWQPFDVFIFTCAAPSSARHTEGSVGLCWMDEYMDEDSGLGDPKTGRVQWDCKTGAVGVLSGTDKVTFGLSVIVGPS